MKQSIKDKWINELRNDFPDYIETIDRLNESFENIFELSLDYLYCKNQLIKLKRTRKEKLVSNYKETLAGLKVELAELLKKQQ